MANSRTQGCFPNKSKKMVFFFLLGQDIKDHVFFLNLANFFINLLDLVEIQICNMKAKKINVVAKKIDYFFLEKNTFRDWKRKHYAQSVFFFNFLVLGIWSMFPNCCKKIPSFKLKNENLHFSPSFESLMSFSKFLSFVPWIFSIFLKFQFFFSNFPNLIIWQNNLIFLVNFLPILY